jgi:ubiquinone/menaquinone biosynthesis C-methylase UbiE
MNTSSLQKDYDHWHEQMQASDGGEPIQLPWYRSVFPYIRDNVYGRVLEVGCGRGDFAIWLATKVPRLDITAIDFSEASIGIARRRAVEACVTVNFSVSDAQSMDLPDKYFDHVISCECIEPVPQPVKMASEIYRVLKPGGTFCLTTENYLNGMLIAWLHCLLTGRPFNSGSGVQPYENFFFFWHVRDLLKSAGLVIDRSESCHVQWLLLPRIAPARLCTDRFSSRWACFLTKPFGRHFSFFGQRPLKDKA